MTPDLFYNSIVGIRVSPIASNIEVIKEKLQNCFSINEFMNHIQLL